MVWVATGGKHAQSPHSQNTKQQMHMQLHSVDGNIQYLTRLKSLEFQLFIITTTATARATTTTTTKIRGFPSYTEWGKI